MAMVVESVSASAVVSANNTVTITKPTGLAVGDLLIAVLATYTADGSGSGTIDLKSGWTDGLTTVLASNEISNSVQYKVATAGDVAASNFAFTKSTSTDIFRGYLIRASGHNTLDPVGDTSSYINNGLNITSFTGTLTEYTPPADGALVIMQVNGNWSTGGTARTVSGYAVTNVSFTEGFDDHATDSSGGNVVAAAHGIQSTAAAVSTYTATFSTAAVNHYGQLVFFLPPVNATGTNTLATATGAAFAQTGTADTIGSNALATAASQAFTQGGTGTSPTQWTNPDKTATPTWSNPEK